MAKTRCTNQNNKFQNIKRERESERNRVSESERDSEKQAARTRRNRNRNRKEAKAQNKKQIKTKTTEEWMTTTKQTRRRAARERIERTEYGDEGENETTNTKSAE